MLRWLFNIASAASLLLCIAVAALWVDGVRATKPKRPSPGRTLYTANHRLNAKLSGKLLMLTAEAGTRTPGGGFRSPPGQMFNTDWRGPQFRTPLGQFGYLHSIPGFAFQARLYFPAWPACVLLLLLPVTWLIAWRIRQRRRHSNVCPVCGYNLTGNTSGVCPECGTAVSQKSEVVA